MEYLQIFSDIFEETIEIIFELHVFDSSVVAGPHDISFDVVQF